MKATSVRGQAASVLCIGFGVGIAAALLLTGCEGAPGAGQASVLQRTPRPQAAAAAAAGTCTGTGAHDRHAASAIACTVCHSCGGLFEFSARTYPRGTTTAGGVLTPSSGSTPASCAVACHYPMGTPSHSISWNTVGPLECTSCHAVQALPPAHPPFSGTPTRADCLGCHDVTQHTSGTVRVNGHGPAWMDQAGPSFHAYSANLGLTGCRSCHATDLSGGIAGVACGSCHDAGLPAGVASWRVNCVMCHGGTDNRTGAPPRATWGRSSDPVRVGAHTAHVAGSALAPAFDCGLCHLKPADALAAGHIDAPTAGVTFAGLALDPTAGSPAAAWDRPSATCSNTYCHGATLGGGSLKTPVWTSGASQAACGTCHGAPPPSPHPSLDTNLRSCNICHNKTVDVDGNVIPPAAGGLHLDGLVEATGHEPSWTDPASPGFHAFSADRGLATCTPCHGADLSGGISTVACARCHGASWRTTCTMCHGGTDNLTGAPPRAIWGFAGDAARGGGTLDPVRVGAHTTHVRGSSLSAAIDCTACHVTPVDALSAGHVDGATATVTFGGRAVQGGAAPTWSRGSATCASTYCHGSYQGTFSFFFYDSDYTVAYSSQGGRPVWTGGAMACDSCHGNPPSNFPWHGQHNGGNDCALCHPDVTGASGRGTAITNPALHVNGVVDVLPKWRSSCFNCH